MILIMTINTVIYVLLFTCISRLGFTDVISDQGQEFVNKLNEEFMALAGMQGTVFVLHSTLLRRYPYLSCLNS